jgi:hypothetical protein
MMRRNTPVMFFLLLMFQLIHKSRAASLQQICHQKKADGASLCQKIVNGALPVPL